jgi:serine kinase of HPr protein (carbohydrate metabolism regulator)
MTQTSAALNIHGVAVQIGRCGILIEGPAGAGKTTLAFELVERMRMKGGHGAIIADDRCLLQAAGGRLIARAPEALAGLAELSGLGIIEISHARAGIIDLAVRLVPPEAAERMPQEASCTHCGVTLPILDAAMRKAQRNARLIFAHPALAQALA